MSQNDLVKRISDLDVETTLIRNEVMNITGEFFALEKEVDSEIWDQAVLAFPNESDHLSRSLRYREGINAAYKATLDELKCE
ncbi:hypothetical protein [Vibrio scophthalmi]|nr:hypothetical protein [Vibrio scophthalmi]